MAGVLLHSFGLGFAWLLLGMSSCADKRAQPHELSWNAEAYLC